MVTLKGKMVEIGNLEDGSGHAALRIANDRAHRIATMAAKELIGCEGRAPNNPDEVLIPPYMADDHMLDCIAHLVQAGEAIAHKTEDGYIAVLFQDLILSSLSADDKGGV